MRASEFTKHDVVESTSGVTPTGYTWSFEHGGEVPWKTDVEVNTFIRVKDSKGKTVLGVWADVYRDDVEIQYSEVFDKKLRGKGIYTDFLKELAKHYNIISDQDQNNAARNIYKKLGADYNYKSERHTLRKSRQGVAEGSDNLSYIGNCTDDDVIEQIFGDATNFAQTVEEYGDDFELDDLVVKYDPESDIHSFYYKQQGVAEGSLNEFSTGGRDGDDDGDDRGRGLTRQEFKNALKLALGYDMAGVDVSTFEGGMLRIQVNGERRIVPCNKLGVKDATAFVKRIKKQGVAEDKPDKKTIKSLEKHYSGYDQDEEYELQYYTGGDYGRKSASRVINKPLGKEKGVVPPAIAGTVAKLDAATTRHVTPRELTVYYGTGPRRSPDVYKYGASVIKNIKPKSVPPFEMINHAYTSTTLDSSIADNFSVSQKVDAANYQEHTLTIKVPKEFKGAYVGHLSAMLDKYHGDWDELEFILPRGTRFTILPNPTIKKYTNPREPGLTLWQFNWQAVVANTAQQGVAEGSENNKISFQVQKGKNKFATTLTVDNKPAGVYQYDANTGRSIAEVYSEYKGKGFGKILVLHAIYTAALLGLNFQEDDSRTAEYDNVLDSLSNNGYIVDDDGYWYVTDNGEKFLKKSLKQGVAETFDQPYKVKSKKKDFGEIEMSTQLPDGSDLNIVFAQYVNRNNEKVAEVDFYRDETQEVTGEGDAQRIFATVINAITRFVKQYKPQILKFSASVFPGAYDNQSRVNLYNRLVQRYAAPLGYDVSIKGQGDMVEYFLSKKEGVAEAAVDEMALSTYKTMGDFDKPGPFRGPDKKLVPHQKNIEKATKFFEQTPYDFRLFFSNIPGTGKYSEYGPMDPSQIKQVFGNDADEIIAGSQDAITVVYVGNKGDRKVMLTPWMMAHRFGHAIQSGARKDKWSAWNETEKHFFNSINNTLEEYYGKAYRGANTYRTPIKWDMTPEYNALFNAIGTQRSSRSGEIRRPYEFLYELFAQYLGTGKVTFNPLPTNLTYGRKVWGNPTKYMNIKPELRDEATRKEVADQLAYDMELMFNDVLAASVGKIFVM